ncbi:uncharacterized protein LOC129769565 isoform X2 [Toxorhynchites rutilus septentrionalis]|uniref:uncharacterized protein LOC129769565 isoform X2 n=1 Tax=Toxorhynchites rutilus septentrionalis TaxID=329112 RepID=UPI002478C4D7|nr:uncharacterized protein LOC129769565 isoform X2 [Toxorhynchites rutilus septentrionalis]
MNRIYQAMSWSLVKPLKVDVIDLTLLLKSMGFKLEYLDFEKEKLNCDTLTVDIKCNKSGVKARMSYDLVDCSCPEKDEKETSFWEVQATGPKEFSKFKNNTSSNLLPEVSENCSLVSKAMLSNLLDYYRSSIKSIERGEDVLRSPLKVAMPKVCITSPDMISVPSSFSTPPAEGKCVPRKDTMHTPENTVSIDPALSPMKPKSLAGSSENSPKASTVSNDTKSNNSTGSIEIGNTTRELSKSSDGSPREKPMITSEPIQDNVQLNVMPDDNSFVNSDAMKAIITSSPNEKVFEGDALTDQNNERDVSVIQCLEQARQKIDAALLVMKLNSPYQRPLSRASVLTTTPQTVIRKKILTPNLPERSNSFGSVSRRMSLPGRADTPKINGGPPSFPKKKTPGTSQLASSRPLGSRGDTPRPSAAQIKSVTMLRKTSSSSSVASTGNTKSGSISTLKKSVTVTKPVGSVRPTSIIGKPATMTKSSSTTSIDKK